MKKTLFLALGLAGAMATPALVSAETQGTLGATSTGTLGLQYIKESSVMISGLADLDFGSDAVLVNDRVLQSGFCVFSSTGAFRLTPTGANPGTNPNDFAMAAGSGDIINYIVNLGSFPAEQGVLIPGLIGDSNSTDCGGTPNMTLEVIVPAGEFNAAAPLQYNDTLTLFVEPE